MRVQTVDIENLVPGAAYTADRSDGPKAARIGVWGERLRSLYEICLKLSNVLRADSVGLAKY